MKWVSILAIALLSAMVSQIGAAQTAGSPVDADSNSQIKHDEKDKKAKLTATKVPIKAETGRKTTTSQDDAYTLAARKGNAETSQR